MIKLRAWDRDKKVMRKVAHIYNLLTVGTTVVVRENVEGAIIKVERSLKEGSYDLMQYTGLNDKNGKELYYDSDIVLLDGSDKKFKAIKDDFDTPVWVADEGELIIDFRDWFLSQKRKSFEIIGNIMESQNYYTPQQILNTSKGERDETKIYRVESERKNSLFDKTS